MSKKRDRAKRCCACADKGQAGGGGWRCLLLILALLGPRWGVAAPSADAQKISFAIAGGDASVTLEQFSVQSGIEIVYLVDQVRSVTTNPIAGRLTAREALDAMLKGTSLTAVGDAQAHAFVIKRRFGNLSRSVGAAPTPPEAKPAQPGNSTPGEVVRLPTLLTIDNIPSDEQIVPTVRPFGSVFDLGENILDTPRSVTIISSAQLIAIDIDDVRDFSELTSSSYTATNFGAASNPTIRGQYADILVNGMRERTTSNGNGMPIDFNAFDSINIVKGPASVVQGPSNYVGGFADLISKRPYFDEFRGSAWTTIGSYDTKKWGLDIGGPVSPALAYRLSYAGEDSGGFYWGQYSKNESLYGALTWRPSENYELFFNVHGYVAEYTDNFGINRPSQALIDDGLYVTGININNGAEAAPSDPQNSMYVKPTGNIIAFGPAVEFNRHLRLENPDDGSIGRSLDVQGIQTFYLSPNFKIVNPTLLTYLRRETYDSYYFDEVINPDFSLESRVEAQLTLDRVALNLGLNGRYTETQGYNDYMFEAVPAWDITRDPYFINVKNSIYFPGAGEEPPGGGPTPGFAGFYGNAQLDGGNSNQSWSMDGAPFAEAIWKVTNRLSLDAGARADYLSVNSADPFTPGAQAGLQVWLPNENASLLYQIVPDLTAYATYNYSRNPSGVSAEGGGFDGLAAAANGAYYLEKPDYVQPSALFEIGAKAGTSDHKLYAGISVYQQTRTAESEGAPPTTELVRGAEFEVNYQPSRTFYGTFSYSLMAASVAAGTTTDTLDGANAAGQYWAPGVGPDTQITGRVVLQGQPRNQWNALVSYRLGNHWVASLNATLHDDINNNWAGTIVIPWEYTLNGSLAYATQRWAVRLFVRNLTNTKNWSPPNSTYGNESIVADPGTEAELTITRKF